jgi:hypothetical protein
MKDISAKLRDWAAMICTSRNDLVPGGKARLMLDAAAKIDELEGLLASSIVRERMMALETKRLRAKLTEYEEDAIADDLIRGEG